MNRFLGVDYGHVRIGLSHADDLGIAFPLPAITTPNIHQAILQLREICHLRKINHIIVGYPINMDNSIGIKVKEVDQFIQELKVVSSLPIITIDERLTTHEAMIRSGFSKKSPQEQMRLRKNGYLDSLAATIMLQDYLDETIFGNPSFPNEIKTV